MIYPKRNLEFDSASAALSWAQQLNRCDNLLTTSREILISFALLTEMVTIWTPMYFYLLLLLSSKKINKASLTVQHLLLLQKLIILFQHIYPCFILNLAGIITQRLGGILKLMLFSLENNQIEGSIPIRAIGKLISLKELYLGVNNLTGMALKNSNHETTETFLIK